MVHVLEDTIVVTSHVRVVTVVRNQSMTDYMSRSTGLTYPSRATMHSSACAFRFRPLPGVRLSDATPPHATCPSAQTWHLLGRVDTHVH